MQRVYRRRQKRWAGILKGGYFLAVLITAGCLWTLLPAKTLRTLSFRIIEQSQPSIVKYVIHMETPRMSLLERLLSPQLVSYSFQEAAREGTVTETSGTVAYGDIMSSSVSDTVTAAEGEGEASVSETGTDSSSSGSSADGSDAADSAGTSLLLSVGTEAQAELLQENIYGGTGAGVSVSAQESDSASASDSAASNLTVFDEITGQEAVEGISPVLQQTFTLTEYDSFDALIKEFYVVDSSTQATASLINLESLTSYDCTISTEDAAPQILIYHSHSQETYIDSDAEDPSTTIVGVGEHLTELLESYGYSVLHHEGTYDVPSRDDAYSKALPAIEALLEEYPSIEVVIDLHRDAVAEGTKLLYTYEGKDYARFMFFNGISRTASGPIEYLYNENLSANLAFSFQAEVIAESYFPGITRGIYLKAWRYNMHLMPKYMLIELGAQTNTVEEAMNTCEILAFVLDQVLSGEAD